jgi:O-antigen/teichoic acid export membrane protein
VLQRVYNLYVVLLRSHKRFIFAGFLNILSSFITLMFTLLLVWKFKLYGFFAALLFHYAFLLVLLHIRTSYRFRFRLSLAGLKPLLSLGSAVLISDLLRTAMQSIDRIMIVKFLGYSELGVYSIALMASNYLYMLPNMLGIIFFPHLQETFAQRDSRHDLEKYLREPTLCIAFFFPFLLGFVWILSPWLIRMLLPQYVEGLAALRYLTLGSFFMALTHVFMNYMITIRRHWALIPLQGVLVIVGFVSAGLILENDRSIERVALVMSVLYGLYFVLLCTMAYQSLRHLAGAFWLQLRILGIFLWIMTALRISSLPAAGHAEDLPSALARFLFFALLMAPILGWAQKETGILTTIRHAIAEIYQKRKITK